MNYSRHGEVRSSQYPENLASELNRYFIANVQLSKEEKKAAYQEAMPIIEKLARYVNKADPRFGAEAIKVGSSFQGLKVGEPNEYDVNIPLQGIPQYSWGGGRQQRYYSLDKPHKQSASFDDSSLLQKNNQTASEYSTPPPQNYKQSASKYSTSFPQNYKQSASFYGPPLPQYYNLKKNIGGLSKTVDEITIFQTSEAQPWPEGLLQFIPLICNSPMWTNSDDLTFDGDIIPILLKKHFKKLLIEGIRELGLREKVKVDRRFHGPAITIKIDSKDIEISIDFSIVISRAISFPNDAGWPHPQKEWPSGQKKDILSNIGLSFVSRKDIHWMMSPALAERELMKGIDQPGECRKKSHRIMKKLNEDLWSKRSKAISSYALKNVLFFECENFPQSWQWTADKLPERILSMTKKLYECVGKEELNLFFLPQRNLLKKDNEAERNELLLAKDRIEKFLNDPLEIMQRLNAN